MKKRKLKKRALRKRPPIYKHNIVLLGALLFVIFFIFLMLFLKGNEKVASSPPKADDSKLVEIKKAIENCPNKETVLELYGARDLAAIVNCDYITNAKLEQILSPFSNESRKFITSQLLDSEINMVLLAQEAKKENISATDEETMEQLNELLNSYNISRERYENDILVSGRTLEQDFEEFRVSFAIHKLLDNKVRSKINISDEEIRAEYDKLQTPELPFEALRDDIEKDLYNSKRQIAYKAYLDELRANASILIMGGDR